MSQDQSQSHKRGSLGQGIKYIPYYYYIITLIIFAVGSALVVSNKVSGYVMNMALTIKSDTFSIEKTKVQEEDANKKILTHELIHTW